MEEFFMGYIEGESSPGYKHDSLVLAEKEAKRLAEKLNKKAYVLCSLKSFELLRFKETDCRPIDDLPF